MIALAPAKLVFPCLTGKALTQQHGFIHAGILATGLDSAGGYAAVSLMEKHAAVLTVALKTSVMAPASRDRFLFKASVIKPGRTLTFVEVKAYAFSDGNEKRVASMTATMMAVVGRDDVVG